MGDQKIATQNNSILLYKTSDGKVKLEVFLQDETVWLTQEHMARLFNKSKSTINEHINNIYKEGELTKADTTKKFGISEFQRKAPLYYNLDVIISVGYRVKSREGTQFRIWATQRLREYIVKGFVLNDERFKSGKSMNYFNELQERIREIRLSERFFYQKIKDIYATSIDYDPKDEMKSLGLLVEQYLAFAEAMARQKKPMYMKDWIKKLDEVLQMNGRELLEHAGKISHQKMLEKTETEYKKYKNKQREIEKLASLKELEDDLKQVEKVVGD